MSHFLSSEFIWAEEAGEARNGFVSFERRFSQPTDTSVWLHLFADTRFRLWVNESFVAYGPARFVTQFPEFDSYDIAPLLIAGENVVRVEVNFYGASSYQSMSDGKPGFIAEGGSADGTVDFVTPGAWTARHHKAWAWDAPLFSFAQNPAEICDTRLLSKELSSADSLVPVQTLLETACPWGDVLPRTVPYPDYAPRRPRTILLAGPLMDDQMLYGVQSYDADFVEHKERGIKSRRTIATWLHAPEAQSIEIGCFWSEMLLNGQLLDFKDDTLLGNHGTTTLALQSGWNLLEIRFEILTELWSYLLGIPKGLGITLHALPNTACVDVFGTSPLRVANESHVELSVAPDSYVLPSDWTLDSGNPAALTPARVMAWDRPKEPKANRGLAWAELDEVAEIEAQQATWSLDFRLEYYGHPVIVVDAPAGSTLDVAYDDWKRSDDCANIYTSNPFTDAADRFILEGGRQTIDVLNPRGGIFLQVTLRSPQGSGPARLKLEDVFVRQRTTIQASEGSFASGNSTFDWAWSRSVNTLIASTDDAYSDCPWRERGSYIGDGLVGLNLDDLVMSDLAVARRTFLNFGRAIMPSGMLPGCAPAWLNHTHEDFSLLWIIAIRDYWAMTGDTTFIEENWSVLQTIFSYQWTCHSSGLWNVDPGAHNIFIDWGADIKDRIGEANSAINILRVGSLRAAAQMAEVIGRTEEATAFHTEAEAVTTALMQYLWIEEEGRFAPSLDRRGNALHSNVWALHFGVGPTERLVAYLEPHLRENLNRGVELGQHSGHIELYFLYFVLSALAEAGHADLAEQMVLDHYGLLEEINNETLNECFCRAVRKVGSCCHTWSSAGGIYAQRYVLGLRQREPGNPDLWVLDPMVTGRFTEVTGSYPHPKGTIKVNWRRQGDRILAEISAPEGVTVAVADGVELAGELVEV